MTQRTTYQTMVASHRNTPMTTNTRTVLATMNKSPIQKVWIWNL